MREPACAASTTAISLHSRVWQCARAHTRITRPLQPLRTRRAPANCRPLEWRRVRLQTLPMRVRILGCVPRCHDGAFVRDNHFDDTPTFVSVPGLPVPTTIAPAAASGADLECRPVFALTARVSTRWCTCASISSGGRFKCVRRCQVVVRARRRRCRVHLAEIPRDTLTGCSGSIEAGHSNGTFTCINFDTVPRHLIRSQQDLRRIKHTNQQNTQTTPIELEMSQESYTEQPSSQRQHRPADETGEIGCARVRINACTHLQSCRRRTRINNRMPSLRFRTPHTHNIRRRHRRHKQVSSGVRINARTHLQSIQRFTRAMTWTSCWPCGRLPQRKIWVGK